MSALKAIKGWWIGIFGGFISWYAAHDLGFYYSDYNCRHRWILPTVHFLALICGLLSIYYSFRAMRIQEERPDGSARSFLARVGVGAASIFTLVIVWQGVAAIIYSGCER